MILCGCCVTRFANDGLGDVTVSLIDRGINAKS